MGDRNYPYASIGLPKLVDASGDGSKTGNRLAYNNENEVGYQILHKLDLDAISSWGSRARATQYTASLPQSIEDSDEKNSDGYAIVNSCYGFICLHKPETKKISSQYLCSPSVISSQYAICNPVTHEVVLIPKPYPLEEVPVSGFPIVSGFGCSLESKRYKLLRIVLELSTEARSNKTRYILKFDVEHETFGSFQLPSCFHLNKNVDVGVLRGCIYASRVVESRDLEIWVMPKWGEHGSWKRLFWIKLFRDAPTCFKPICLMENGELVLICHDSSLLFYNVAERKVRHLRLNGGQFRPYGDLQAILHEPNFGSLKDILGVRNLSIRNFKSEAVDVEAISLQEDGADDLHIREWSYTLLSSRYYGWD
ncbi:predicted protein [Arabidopsis lyrata subsp. lyrata]|uniref:Predicted protein n=1 Tax=Arabidopsis lyrata subsp. lyrata TaxID=81972 RepID=D7LDK2_ARALL|nr:predicted protein [Arabidopsis lyrata subsp. lyrata]